jgi:hypothetical protein
MTTPPTKNDADNPLEQARIIVPIASPWSSDSRKQPALRAERRLFRIGLEAISHRICV